MEILWAIGVVVVPILIGLGVAMIALPNIVHGETLTARVCFTLSALWILAVGFWWGSKPDAGLILRLIIGVNAGLLVFVLFPISLRWITARSNPANESTPASPPATATDAKSVTLDNVNERVKQWVEEFSKNFQGGDFHDLSTGKTNMYFVYDVIFGDGHGVVVSRNKILNPHLVFFTVSFLRNDPSITSAFNALSAEEQGRFFQKMLIEVSRAKINANSLDPREGIGFGNEIVIDDKLTQDAFYKELQDMHSDNNYLAAFVPELIRELTEEQPKTNTHTEETRRGANDLDTVELAQTTKCQEAIIINKYKNRTLFSKDLESEDCPNYLGDFHGLITRGILQCTKGIASRPLTESEKPANAPPGDQYEQVGQCFLSKKGKSLAEDLIYLREHPESATN